MKDTFVDVSCGWQYGFPRIWDHEKPFNETSLREKQDWVISKGYPRELAHSKSIHFRSWEDVNEEIERWKK